MMEDFRNEENRQHVKNDISALTGEGNMANHETFEKIFKKAFEEGIDTYCALLDTWIDNHNWYDIRYTVKNKKYREMLLKEYSIPEEKETDTLADFFKDEFKKKRQADHFNELAAEMDSHDEATLIEDNDAEGLKAGMDSFFALMKILIENHRTEELARAVEDEKYRDELMEKYHISMVLPERLQEQ